MEILKEFTIGKITENEKNKEVKELFNGSRRRLVEVKLRNNAFLA